MKPKIKHPRINPKAQPELGALALGVGKFIEYWGFKSVQGSLWCYLYLSKEPLSSLQLAQLLKVSPALITQSVKVLLDYRVILPAEKGPNGALRFVANPNVAEAVAGVLKAREAVMIAELEAFVVELSGSVVRNKKVKSPHYSEGPVQLDASRLKQMEDWIQLVGTFLEAGLAEFEKSKNPFTDPREFKDMLDLLHQPIDHRLA